MVNNFGAAMAATIDLVAEADVALISCTGCDTDNSTIALDFRVQHQDDDTLAALQHSIEIAMRQPTYVPQSNTFASPQAAAALPCTALDCWQDH